MPKLFFLFTLIVSFVSCSKDANDSSGSLIYRIWEGNNPTTEFSYDAEGRILKVTMGPVNHPYGVTVYHYDQSGRLNRQDRAFNVSSSTLAVQMDSAFSDFTYDINGRLAETRTYRLERGVVRYASRSVPEYDTKGRINAKTLYDTGGNAVGRTTFQYSDADNITAVDTYSYIAGTPVVSLHEEYEHDHYKNPYEGKWVEPFGVNRNNITKGTSSGYPGSAGVPGGPTSFTIGYKKYNRSGYPVLVSENGVDRVFEYK